MQNSGSTVSDIPERQCILGLIVRSLFKQTWDPKASDSSPEVRKAAFDKARPELRKIAVSIRSFLENNSVQMTLGEPVVKKKPIPASTM